MQSKIVGVYPIALGRNIWDPEWLLYLQQGSDQVVVYEIYLFLHE